MSQPIQWRLSPHKGDCLLAWLIGEPNAKFPYFQDSPPYIPTVIDIGYGIWCEQCGKSYREDEVWTTGNNDFQNPHWQTECPAGHILDED